MSINTKDANGNVISLASTTGSGGAQIGATSIRDFTNPDVGQFVSAGGQAAVAIEGRRATYSICIAAFSPAAGATDVLLLPGSASRTIRLVECRISGKATAAAQLDLFAYKRNAVNAGGTTSNPSILVHDSTDPAASAAPVIYTANPSGLGAGILSRANAQVYFPAIGTPSVPQEVLWELGQRNAKPMVLRGIAESFAINIGGQTIPTGLVLDINLVWTEDTQ